jgi:ABC-type uncharacterized transport system substrate-binding protein
LFRTGDFTQDFGGGLGPETPCAKVDGDNIAIDYLSVDGRGERFPDLAAECLRLKADIIAVSTTPATQVTKSATHTIPIVINGALFSACRL